MRHENNGEGNGNQGAGPPSFVENGGPPPFAGNGGPPPFAGNGGPPPFADADPEPEEPPAAPTGPEGDDGPDGDGPDGTELVGTRSPDVLQGGNGDDTILGQPAEAPFPQDDGDVLIAGNGDDTVNGVGGDDIALGENGDDVVQGGTGDDTLFGNHGDDTLYGRFAGPEDGPTNNENSGNDRLFGGHGDDTLLPGDGSNVLGGGQGDDSFVFDVDSGFFRTDGSDVENRIVDLSEGDRIVFDGYAEPTAATGGDGSIDGVQEANAWLSSLGDAIGFADGNMIYSANGDQLVIEGVADFDAAVDLIGNVQVSWTGDSDMMA
jgi:Ca2+-binding RTX toxin-like protein